MLVITFVSADWRDSVISMTAELQQAVDTGDLCQGLGDKLTISFGSNMLSYTPTLVRQHILLGSGRAELFW